MADQETTMDWKPLIDRMKAEGQLTRNTGTNSIKSVNVNLEKLTGVMETISKSLVMQSSFLESAYNIQTAQYDLDRERAKDEERLRKLQGDKEDTPAPETKPETDDGKGKGKGEDDDTGKSGPSLLSKLFTSGTLLKAAIATVAAPAIWGFLRGAVDEFTGGKFTEFEEIVKKKLPDIFKNIKNMVSLLWTNISTFLETGNIEDLLKDSEGNPVINVEEIKKRAAPWVAGAIAYIVGGPLGAIGVAVAAGIENTLKEVTGIDLEEYLGPEANAAMLLLTGLGLKAAIGSAVTGGLIRGAFVALFTNPFGIAALAVTAGILALMAAAKSGRERVDRMTQDMEQNAADYEAAIEAGDQEAAAELERKIAADTQRLTDRVGGLGPNTEETINRNLAAVQSVGETKLEQDIADGVVIIPADEIDFANERMRALAQYAKILERSDITAEERTEALRNIVALLPENRRRDMEDADLSEIEGSVAAMGILQQLGVRTGFGGNPELERELGGLLNQFLVSRMNIVGDTAFRRQVEAMPVMSDSMFAGLNPFGVDEDDIAEWQATYGQFYNPDGSLKVDALNNITEAMRQQATGAGFAFNAGGNVYRGGDSNSSSATVFNFNGGGTPAQALSNGPHQE